MQKELRSMGSLILLSLLTVVACTFESQVRMTILTHQTNVNSKIGIARCTLLAHVIVQANSELSSVIHISSIHCWCDTIVLHWRLMTIAKSKRFFVRRRVEEIHKLIDVDCWYHLESKLVPPAILSKGL